MSPATDSLAASSRWWLLSVALLIVAPVVSYWNSLSTPFVFDDIPAIVRNDSIRQFSKALTPPADGSSVTGRPLLNLSFALNHTLGGLNPAGYHATNLAIHILAGLALFGLVRRTLSIPSFQSSTAVALAAALLWSLHPLQTESVTFVVQRTESLMGLFFLTTLYCFARAQSTARPALWLTLTCLACALGMACKEVMVTAPVLVWLYDRTFGAGSFLGALRRRPWFYSTLAATWLPLLWLVLGSGGSRGTGAGFGLGLTPWSYALTQCEALLLYLRLAAWPHPLCLDYGTTTVPSLLAVAPQALVLLVLLAATVFALRRRPALGFLGAWFFVTLAPSSSFVPLIGQTIAEHRMYLALAAITTGLACALLRFLGTSAVWPIAVLALACSGLTLSRNRDYRDEISLWRSTIAARPANYRAHYNLATALTRAGGDPAEIAALLTESLRLEPNYPDAHNNLALLLAAQPGREADALAHYETALRLKPDFADAHFNLALLLGRLPGRAPDAIRHYEAALALQPGHADAHNNLAVELAKIPGRLPDAIAHYEAAVRLAPDFLSARENLAGAYYRAGRVPDAIDQLREILHRDPQSSTARRSLEFLLQQSPAGGPMRR